MKTNPKLDLVFERTTTLTDKQIWNAWTDPNTLKKWFCPKPWKVTNCRIDLRAGGEFYTLMKGPNDEIMPNNGCYLDVIKYKKLVWTNMLSENYRPTTKSNMGFSFVITLHLSKAQKGTLYKAIVMHANAEDRKQHETMGFQEGWGAAFDQLEKLMKTI